MAVAYFQVQLTVRPTRGGDAELVLPDALKDLAPGFVVVREGAQEGIVRVEAPETVLKKIAKDERCVRLTAEEMDALRKGYPLPKTKQKYRLAAMEAAVGAAEAAPGSVALDAQGNRIVDTYQTVRSGFYLIDVPLVAPGKG